MAKRLRPFKHDFIIHLFSGGYFDIVGSTKKNALEIYPDLDNLILDITPDILQRLNCKEFKPVEDKNDYQIGGLYSTIGQGVAGRDVIHIEWRINIKRSVWLQQWYYLKLIFDKHLNHINTIIMDKTYKVF